MTDLDVRAKALYDQCSGVAPTWDQLGETTKNVWRERALAEQFADLA